MIKNGIIDIPVIFVTQCEDGTDSSPLWGFARTARNENKDLPIFCIGIIEACEDGLLASRLAELFQGELSDEYEFVFKDGKWHVTRLMPFREPDQPFTTDDYRLHPLIPGQLSTLYWRPINVKNEGLGKYQVRIKPSVVSMHFKDIMLAMGLLPGFEPILGNECCGTITAVGEGVKERYPALRTGTEVLCLALLGKHSDHRKSIFGTSFVQDAEWVIPKPAALSQTEAAASLGVFATAWYALVHVGRLSEQDTLLIHSATGGIGTAAIQIAQAKGARIIASAGNADKRDHLKNVLGIEHVIDSRKPERFVEEVMKITNGRGVDIALNSLAREGLTETLRCLAPNGRHVEIGKRDILENGKISLSPLLENISFLSVHLDKLAQSHPQLVRDLLFECIELFENGYAKPLPVTEFDAYHVIDAFRLLSVGKHMSKVVVKIPDNFKPLQTGNAHNEPALPWAIFATDGAYLGSTGGHSGVGLALARFLASHGAGRIILVRTEG